MYALWHGRSVPNWWQSISKSAGGFMPMTSTDYVSIGGVPCETNWYVCTDGVQRGNRARRLEINLQCWLLLFKHATQQSLHRHGVAVISMILKIVRVAAPYAVIIRHQMIVVITLNNHLKTQKLEPLWF